MFFEFFTNYCCRYERLLRRAKMEDLSEVSGIGCLYQSGTDRQGRPVVVFVGKWFPANNINLDKVRNLYAFNTLIKNSQISIVFSCFYNFVRNKAIFFKDGFKLY